MGQTLILSSPRQRPALQDAGRLVHPGEKLLALLGMGEAQHVAAVVLGSPQPAAEDGLPGLRQVGGSAVSQRVSRVGVRPSLVLALTALTANAGRDPRAFAQRDRRGQRQVTALAVADLGCDDATVE